MDKYFLDIGNRKFDLVQGCCKKSLFLVILVFGYCKFYLFLGIKIQAHHRISTAEPCTNLDPNSNIRKMVLRSR